MTTKRYNAAKGHSNDATNNYSIVPKYYYEKRSDKRNENNRGLSFRLSTRQQWLRSRVKQVLYHIFRNRKTPILCFLLLLFCSSLQIMRPLKEAQEQSYPKQMYLIHHPDVYESNNLSKDTTFEGLLPFVFDEKHESLLSDNTDIFETHDCKAMDLWQLESHPSCNLLHEIRDIDRKLLSSGSYRDTWLVRHDKTAFAVKTLVFEDEMSARNLERHRRDAVIMSMLTSSIHIPNIYAHCGDSGIFDYSPDGNMESIIRSVEKSKRETLWSSEQMLRYAWQVAKALSEVHSVGSLHQAPAIVHTDIDIDQFLWIDGMFKLNDFNRARFMRWNVLTNEPCNFFIASSPGSARSPEEYLSKHSDPQNETLTPKVDVYSLGNIFYTILTKERVFRHKRTKYAQEDVKNGRFPSIPREKVSNFSAIEKSIYKAMEMCHTFNYQTRSTAKEVEKFLKKEMETFQVSFFDGDGR